MEEVIIPGPLCCRMTGELMNEPGLIETGDCYERIVIENWINSGKKYDPISKEELKITKVILCSNLKMAIEDFKKKLSPIQLKFIIKANEVSVKSTLEEIKSIPNNTCFDETPLKRIIPKDSFIENQLKEKINEEKRKNRNLTNLKKIYSNGYHDYKDDEGNNVLHINCKSSDYKAVKFLLTLKDININAKNKYGNTALHFAVMKNNIDIAKHLLSNGAKVDDKDNLKRTPLFFACTVGNFLMIEMLVDNGADVKIRDIHGVSLLHLASKVGNTFIAEYLITKGVSAKIKDKYGKSPLDYVLNNV